MKKKLLLLSGMLCVTLLQNNVSAQALNEGFEDITTLAGAGWTTTNLSTPIGTVPNWSQGTATSPFVANTGAGFIAVNYNSVAGANTISNWLIAPTATFTNGDVITFYTRTVNAPAYADRLQVRLSTNGSSANVGATNTSVGDFTTMLLEINATQVPANYPNTWTQYTITISGLAGPTPGRLAFRYFVTNGGPSGSASDFIGIDDYVYTPFGAPVAANLAVSNPVKNYTGIPLSQVTALPLTATVANSGTAATTDAMLTVNVYEQPNLTTPIQTTNSSATSIAIGANSVLTAGTFTPSTVGSYVIEYVSSCTGNTITSADTAFYSIEITNSLYARDDSQISGSYGIGAGPTGYIGAMYTIVNATELDSVMIALAKPGSDLTVGDGVGDSTRITVYSVSGGLPSTIIGQSPAYVFTPADTGVVVVSTHAINAIGGGNLSLTPGTYFVAVTEYNTNVGLAYSNNIFKPATYYAGWTGQAFTPVENFGANFSKAVVIRPILSDCVPTSSSISANVCYGSSYTYTDGLVVNNLMTDESRMITLQNAAGCDSIVTESVTVSNQINTSVSMNGTMLSADENGATYQWIDCGNGNAPISGETNQQFTATVTGDYAVIITVGSCSDTSTCQNVSVIGVNELNALAINLYPNPTKDVVNVSLKETGEVKYSIVTLDGKLIQDGVSVLHSFNVDLRSYPSGIYILNVEQSGLKGTYRLVKE